MGDDILDRAYLTEMRQWVGEGVFATLMAQAHDNLPPVMAEMLNAWQHGDGAAFLDLAHRMKGAASSVGCRALSLAAHSFMRDPRPAETVSGAEIEALGELTRASLKALRELADQPQEMPVPARPQ